MPQNKKHSHLVKQDENTPVNEILETDYSHQPNIETEATDNQIKEMATQITENSLDSSKIKEEDSIEVTVNQLQGKKLNISYGVSNNGASAIRNSKQVKFQRRAPNNLNLDIHVLDLPKASQEPPKSHITSKQTVLRHTKQNTSRLSKNANSKSPHSPIDQKTKTEYSNNMKTTFTSSEFGKADRNAFRPFKKSINQSNFKT